MNEFAKTADRRPPRPGRPSTAFCASSCSARWPAAAWPPAARRYLRRGRAGRAGRRPTDLQVHLEVLDPASTVPWRCNGSVGAGEAWMEGMWRCDNLVGLIQLLVRNRDLLDGMESGLARLGGMAMRGWHALRRNTRGRQPPQHRRALRPGQRLLRPVPVAGPDVLLGDLDRPGRHAGNRIGAQARTHLPQARPETDATA